MKVPGKIVGVIVLAALVLVIVPRALGWRSDRDQWEARNQRLETQLVSTHDSVATLLVQDMAKGRQAAREKAKADSAKAAAEAELAATKRRLAEIRNRVVTEAPDTCAPFLAALDSVAEAAIRAADGLRAAYANLARADSLKDERIVLLQTAVRIQGVSLDSALAVLRDRPKPPSLLGLGVTAGVCTVAARASLRA